MAGKLRRASANKHRRGSFGYAQDRLFDCAHKALCYAIDLRGASLPQDDAFLEGIEKHLVGCKKHGKIEKSQTLGMTQVRADPGECRAYSARIIFEIGSRPSGLGSRLADGPPGLASMAILRCHFFLNLPQASWLLRMTQLRTAAQLDMGGDGWTELWGVVRGEAHRRSLSYLRISCQS